MKRKLKHVLAGLRTGDKKIDNMKVKICGEKWIIYVCDEPEWMGPHTWHVDSISCMQWGHRTENGKLIVYPPVAS